MDAILEDHYLTQIEGLQADVRYWKRAAALNKQAASSARFYDSGEYGLLLVNSQADAWRHFELCQPGKWLVCFSSHVTRWCNAGHAINAVVDDFGDLVRVD